MIDKYADFVKNLPSNTKPFTRTQVEFIQFLLEHSSEVNKIGDLETPFELVRKYLKK